MSWTHPQQKAAWNVQGTPRSAGSIFRTLRIDPLNQSQSAFSKLRAFEMGDVVNVHSPIVRQENRMAIVDRVEEEYLILRSRFGFDESLNQVRCRVWIVCFQASRFKLRD